MRKLPALDALVSICITSFNYGRYLRDAIDSALSQTYAHIEVVVSDNASTDCSLDILSKYLGDPRVRVFVNEENVGMCRNHNLAITRARGDYIVVLSADDIIFPQHVERLMRRIQDPKDPVLIAYGQAAIFDEALEPIRPTFAYGNLPCAYSRRDDFGNVLFIYHHVYPAKLIAREAYDRVGLFDERIVTAIDMEICARFEAADIPTAYVPELVAGLREHDHRMSANPVTAKTNIVFSDRLFMYEHALKPQNAWRIEGYEKSILAVVDSQLNVFASIGFDALDEHQSSRMETVRGTFEAYSQTIPEWPQSEPQLSVVILSEGYLALLKASLDAIAAQTLERIEIIIVQTSGCDVEPLLARFPYADRIRVIQVRACATPSHAYRHGLDLARGEYVTYLAEGQAVGDRLYADVVAYARLAGARLVFLPRESINEWFPLMIVPEIHPHQFHDPSTRARARVAGSGYALCHLLHRRALLRIGTVFHETMISEDEATFTNNLSQAYPSITLAHA